MAALNWTTLETNLLSALAQSPPPYNVIPPDFAQLYPQAINYAEGLFYKACVFLATRTEDTTSLQTTAGTRSLALAGMVPNVVVVQETFGLITPAGATTSTGTIQWFTKTSLDFIDRFWPQWSATMAPDAAGSGERFWAPLDNNTFVFAPTPDKAYNAVVAGLFQPATMSAGNPTTYLGSVYPELLTAGCMEWLSGALLRNYGAQSDDPQHALSWKAVREELLDQATKEEMRRRGVLPDMPMPPQPAAPGRPQ